MVVFRTGLRSRSWWTGSGRLQPVPGCDLHLLVFLLTKSVCSKQQDYPLPLPHARAAAHRQVKTFNGRLKLRFAILEAILSDFSKIGNAYSSAFDDASKHGPKTAQKHMKSPPNSVFNRGVPCGTRRGRQRRYCRGTSGRNMHFHYSRYCVVFSPLFNDRVDAPDCGSFVVAAGCSRLQLVGFGCSAIAPPLQCTGVHTDSRCSTLTPPENTSNLPPTSLEIKRW